MRDIILEKMFDSSRWTDLINKCHDKGLDINLLRSLSEPQARIDLYMKIKEFNYIIEPARIVQIPKDKPGEYREVHVNNNIDRLVLTLINDVLFELFPHYIHKNCTSYQKGKGSQETVCNVAKKISKIKENKLGYKADLSKYFDSVNRDIIHDVFDRIEKELGYELYTNPTISLLRDYYNLDKVYNVDGELVELYGSLKQGCAVASFLSNVILYDIDEEISNIDNIMYCRYSDDLLIIGKGSDDVKDILDDRLSKLGLSLNPNKVETLYKDKWFQFLGFQIKGNLITLSKNRIKKFQKEITSRTINKPRITEKQAKTNIITYLYKGDRSWASSCLGTINVEKDILELNKFIMDCIRAVKVRNDKNKTGKISISAIGGLGVVQGVDSVIVRGVGKNVKRNKLLTNTTIENYLSINCLSKTYKIDKCVFNTCVNSI